MIVNLATGLAIIVLDVIVLVVTWIKTFGHVREASRIGVNVSLSAILLRDGESL